MSRIDFVTGAPEKYAHLVEALATVPERLREVLAGRSNGDLQRESEGHWSPVRVMQHMLLYAARNGVFIHQMGTMTDPIRATVDDAEAEAYPTDPQRLADMIEREIGHTVAFLSHLPDASWGRPGLVLPGRRSLRQQVRLHTEHMDEHIAQIQAALG